jgi:hypothetical protein
MGLLTQYLLEQQLLNEKATLSKYGPGKLVQISGNQRGVPLANALKQQGVDPTGPMELLDFRQATKNIKNVSATVGKDSPGVISYAFKNSKGQIWLAHGSPEVIHYHGATADKTSGTTDIGKISNRGDVAEGILGAAMFAKFTKREGNDIGLVTVQDIIKVLSTLRPMGNDIYQVQVKDKDNRHADTITFKLELKTAPYQDLLDPVKRPLLAKEYSSAMGYVNSSAAQRYSRFFYLNGKADDIAIIADGKAGEGEVKPDVWVAIRDLNGNMRKLKLNISLKTKNEAQFGQVGGHSLDKMRQLWQYFGINIDEHEFAKKYEGKSKKDIEQGLAYMYGEIAQILAQQLTGDNENAEVRFVDELSNAIQYFATMNDSTVELVDFDAGGFKILRFNKLREQLRHVDLTASFVKPKTEKGKPEIIIHQVGDLTNILVGVRVKIENKVSERTGEKYIYYRNIIEKGPLLEKLTTIQQKTWKELAHPDPKDIAQQLGGLAPERQHRTSTPEPVRQRRR